MKGNVHLLGTYRAFSHILLFGESVVHKPEPKVPCDLRANSISLRPQNVAESSRRTKNMDLVMKLFMIQLESKTYSF